jgi:hypothetical protein
MANVAAGRRLDALAHGDDEPAIAAVGDLSDHQRQQDHRHELHEADQPEVERAACQRVKLPAHRDPHHLESHACQDSRGQQEGERRATQERSSHAARWCREGRRPSTGDGAASLG